MQDRKASAPTWSKIIFVILCIVTVLSAGLYGAIQGNQWFAWGIPFARWAEVSGLQAFYQEFLLPTGLLYFVAIPFMITLLWGTIVLLLKMSAKERLALAQTQQEEVFSQETEEPETLPDVEETATPEYATVDFEEAVFPEQECPAEPVPAPETAPVMPKRLSAEEIREMYRKSLRSNQESEPEDPLGYLSELYYQDQEEKY